MMQTKLLIGKIALVVVIAATSVVGLFFVEYDEPTRWLAVAKFLAKTGSLVGTVLLVWQFLLGFRMVSSWLCRDVLWGYMVHRIVGIGGVSLILLHPVFITIYYLQMFDWNIWAFRLSERFSIMVLLGVVAYLIMAVVVLTSTLWRAQLSKRIWYRIHLSTYAVPVLIFVHGLAIGMTLRGSGLKYYWYVLMTIVVGFTAVRIAALFGAWTGRYRVSSVKQVSSDTNEIIMHPEAGALSPGIGQFVYVRCRRCGSARPYTAAHFDSQSKRLGVTVKAFGSGSKRIHSVQPNELMYVDGPYGVFLDAAFSTDRPLVMVAGGIGITPFLRLGEYLEGTKHRKGWLFYGNKFSGEIAYKQELESLSHIKVVHVISDEPDYQGEQGYITCELFRKYLPGELDGYEFLLCGPAVMTKKLRSQLMAEGVSHSRIHYELFSL